MNRYQDIVSRINWWLFLVVIALLPFPQTPLRYACVLWIVSWAAEGRWLSKPQSIKQNPMAIPFLLFGAWYGWKILSGLWAEDYNAWAWQMERYMTFGLMIPVGIWGVNRYYNVRTIGKVLVYSCLAAVPLYLGVMTALFYHRDIIPTIPILAEWHYQTSDWFFFIEENISHIKHRLFLCSVEFAGMIAAIWVWREKKWVWLPICGIVFLFILITGSRQSILTAILLVIIGILYRIPKTYRWQSGIGMLLIGGIIGIGLVTLHPRSVPFKISHFTHMLELGYDHDVRLNIWGIALQHPEDYAAYGLGAGQSPAYMLDRFHEMYYDAYADMHYHVHNQYLEEIMEIGIGGLMLFLLAWLSILFCARGKGRRTAVFYMVLFMLPMCTDCMFGRFCGIALWATGLVVIFLQSHSECDEQATWDTKTH